VVWDAVCAALLPVALHELNAVITRFIAHLRRANERERRPRQLDNIRRLLNSSLHPAPLAAPGATA
jgi:hypothetical protein